jgi:hypothetical protein
MTAGATLFALGLLTGLAAATPLIRSYQRLRKWGMVAGRTRRERMRAWWYFHTLSRRLDRDDDNIRAEWLTRRTR